MVEVEVVFLHIFLGLIQGTEFWMFFSVNDEQRITVFRFLYDIFHVRHLDTVLEIDLVAFEESLH